MCPTLIHKDKPADLAKEITLRGDTHIQSLGNPNFKVNL